MITIIDSETYNNLKGYDFDSLIIKQLAWMHYDINGSLVNEGFYEFNEYDPDKVVQALTEINNLLIDTWLLVGHNLAFDENLLVSQFIKYNIPFNFYGDRFCTMKSTGYFEKDIYYRDNRLSLTELYLKLFNQDFENKHIARSDAIATAKCFWWIVKSKHIELDSYKLKNRDFNFAEIEEHKDWFNNLSFENKAFFGSYFLSEFESRYFMRKEREYNLNDIQLNRLCYFITYTKEIYYKYPDLSPLRIFKSIEKLECGSFIDDEFGVSFYLSDVNSLEPICQFRNLKRLSFNTKDLAIYPIGNLVSLEYLEFHGPIVFDIYDLDECIKLKELYIRSSNIVDISPFENLVELEILEIHSENLENIESLKNLQKLRKLTIWSNKLNNLKPLGSLYNLEFLSLKHCSNITNIYPLKGLENLKELDLSHSNISSIIEIERPSLKIRI